MTTTIHDSAGRDEPAADTSTPHNICTCFGCGFRGHAVTPVAYGGWLCDVCDSKKRHPYWPRGRYNGKRIVGVSLKVVVDVTRWRWLPMAHRTSGACHWLCFMSWTEWRYEW